MENLNFNKIETGNFTFHKFNENPEIIGFFIGIENEEGTERVHDQKTFDLIDLKNKGLQGILFKEFNTGEIVAVSTYHTLVKTFNEIDCDFDKNVFKITFKGKKKVGAGEMSIFEIQQATI